METVHFPRTQYLYYILRLGNDLTYQAHRLTGAMQHLLSNQTLQVTNLEHALPTSAQEYFECLMQQLTQHTSQAWTINNNDINDDLIKQKNINDLA